MEPRAHVISCRGGGAVPLRWRARLFCEPPSDPTAPAPGHARHGAGRQQRVLLSRGVSTFTVMRLYPVAADVELAKSELTTRMCAGADALGITMPRTRSIALTLFVRLGCDSSGRYSVSQLRPAGVMTAQERISNNSPGCDCAQCQTSASESPHCSAGLVMQSNYFIVIN